jgi:hypothetical protein
MLPDVAGASPADVRRPRSIQRAVSSSYGRDSIAGLATGTDWPRIDDDALVEDSIEDIDGLEPPAALSTAMNLPPGSS